VKEVVEDLEGSDLLVLDVVAAASAVRLAQRFSWGRAGAGAALPSRLNRLR
jgi:hypothetical protein